LLEGDTVKIESEEDVRNGKAFRLAMGTLGFIWLAAAGGLAVANADVSPQILRTDANAYEPAGAARTSTETPFAAPTGVLDPVLLRRDGGSDQHG
jgi:hypothetical protein